MYTLLTFVDAVHLLSCRGDGQPRHPGRCAAPRGAGVCAAPSATAWSPPGSSWPGVGGPDAVVLREATRMVGVVPNAAYRHFAGRDELLAAVSAAAMGELADRMAAGVARVRGPHGNAARRVAGCARSASPTWGSPATSRGCSPPLSPCLQPHAYRRCGPRAGPGRSPLGQLRAVLDELVERWRAGPARAATACEYPIWSAVHGLAVLTGAGAAA